MKKRLLIIVLSAFIVLSGCSAKSNDKNKADSSSSKADASSKDTSAYVLPTVKNTSGKVLIQTVAGNPTYLFNSYVLSSVEGENVVVDPTTMPSKEIVDLNPAAIVSTHQHVDHYDFNYISSYTCKVVEGKKDDFKTNNFHIYAIPSEHAGDAIDVNHPNIIAVFEVNGLRIAHMGDIGQTKLTDEQLKALGKIDIAFMQLENSFSDMSLENMKGFNILEQFKPTIVIPTHYTDAALPVIESKYGKVTEVKNFLEISKDTLPSKPMNFYHITNTHFYG